MTPNPFQPTRLAGITLKNRILRSATHEGLADESGAPLPALTQKYLQLAKGGVGAIITGYAGVRPEGRCAYHRMLMIDRDELIPAYRTLTDAVHAAGTPLFLQLAHAGRQTRSQVTGLQPVAPSAIRDHMFNEEVPRALKETEIEEIISAFVAGAVRAQAAGFDGVQLHGAHGYLLSEFLSPYMNQRTDRWGGSAENRFRIVGEIIARVKARLPGFPIFIKINGTDGRKNGMRIPEAVEIARRLEQAGCQAIEVSCGVNEDNFFSTRSERNPVEAVFRYSFKIHNAPAFVRPLIKFFLTRALAPHKLPTRLYNVPAARAIKAAVSIPVIVVGGIKTLPELRSVFETQAADFASLCRPLILEPNLIEKFSSGKQTEAKCLSCNYCMLGIEAESLHCYFGKLNSIPSGGKA
jgi:2,4-dienoyl-CoA reductase-like NADH-dependent reductase (Old Yellow Enzyme family)